MNMISKVPGRLRLHSSNLLGRPDLCRHVEEVLAQHDAVREVCASHRTGRVLVLHQPEFDSHVLTVLATQVVRERGHDVHRALQPSSYEPRVRTQALPVGDFVRQAALMGLRSVLPKPWNTLLPVAAQLIRRPAS